LDKKRMLRVEVVDAGYGSVQVLRGISLHAAAGRVTALLGGNGAGKTTMMRAIMGLIPVRSGNIRLDGRPLQDMPSHRIFQEGVALVPQGRELFPEMTVYENLELGLLASPHHGDASRRIAEVFELFPRLRQRSAQRAASLSGGEQQMLATGRALVSKPRVLLLDEPTTGLAPMIVNELQRIIVELNRTGQTIMLVEQNSRMALNVAQYVYVIRNGQIVMEKPAAELAGDDEMFRAYLG
jgi:branched-chain amino acid transport system ATP-binding protein